ncbi:MAG: EMC3/TMCO1 family protein, partial [Promethearchaeota archaeon]
MASLTAVISALLTKWLVDTEELERKQRQIKGHEEEKEKIIELAEVDPERYRKQRKRWERKEEMLKQSQQKMSIQRLKPTCITFLPMIVIFGI